MTRTPGFALLIVATLALPQHSREAANDAVVLRGHTGGVTALQFLGSGDRLVSGSLDGTLRMWNVTRGTTERVLKHGSEVYAVVVASTGEVVSTGGDGRVIVWDAKRGTLLRQAKLPARCVAAAPMGADRVVLGCADARLRIVRTRDLVTEREIRTPTEVFAVAVSPDQQRIASGIPIRIWNANTGDVVVENVRGFGQGGLAYSPDGQWLAGGEWGGGVRFFKAPTGEHVARTPSLVETRSYGPQGFTELKTNMPIVAVAFSADGKELFAGGARKKVEAYQTGVAQDSARIVGSHDATVTSLALTSDGLIASGSLDSTIKVWRSGKEVGR